MYSIDVIKIQSPPSKTVKLDFKFEVLKTAMEYTKEEFGEYSIDANAPEMKRNRALKEMVKGGKINVYLGPVKPDWLKELVVNRVPIRRGILSYRLLLVHKSDIPRFKSITTIEQLKLLRAGLQIGWSTTDIFKQKGFKVVEAANYDGLFLMLDKRRFDYLPRGVYEIYGELEARESTLNDIVVEPTIALYIPTSTFTYISPAEPRLVNRIDKGYKLMLKNRDFEKIFNKYYLDSINKAQLHNRKIIKIKEVEDPLLNLREELIYKVI